VYQTQPLQPTDLGLILSYKCQCQCAHCLYNCGPNWTEWMTNEGVKEALEATLIWRHPFQVHITGGEPFLNFPLLLHATELAKELGIQTYVETNAGWCVNEELVRKRFTILKDSGLLAVLISCSPFHAETVPPKRTIMAITIGKEVFGPHRVIVYLPQWLDQISHFGLEDPSSLGRYCEEFGAQQAGNLFWRGYGLISGGRSGYKLGHLTHKHPPAAFKGENCKTEILHAHHSHFDLYGNYIPGFWGGLALGDWHELPQILESFMAKYFPPLIGILIESGSSGLFEFAQNEHGYEPLTEGYVGKCHLCVDIRRHLVKRNEFSELKPAEFYDSV